jgi:hypothetical protein
MVQDVDPITFAITVGIAIIALIFLFLNPKVAVYVLFFLIIFDLGFFSRWFDVTRYLARLPFLVAILLSVKIGCDYTMNRLGISLNEKIVRIVFKFTILLVITATISTTYNQENIPLGLYELRHYFLLFVLVLSIYHYRPLAFTIEGFIRTLVTIGLIQIPFVIIEHLLITFTNINIWAGRSALDMCSGTFGGYPALVFYQLVAIGSVLTYQLKNGKPIIMPINNYILIIFLIVPLLFSFSRSAMGFLIILCLIILLRNMTQRESTTGPVKTLLLIVCLPIAIFSLFYFFFWERHFDIEKELNPNHVIEYFSRYSRPSIEARIKGEHGVMGRARAVTESCRLVFRTPMQFLFGLGSGSTSEASFLGDRGNYYQRYGPLAGLGRTHISKTIAELGFVGLAVLLIFFITLLRQIRRVDRLHESFLATDIYMVILINILMMAFYTTVLVSSITMFVLGYFIALIQSKLNTIIERGS